MLAVAVAAPVIGTAVGTYADLPVGWYWLVGLFSALYAAMTVLTALGLLMPYVHLSHDYVLYRSGPRNSVQQIELDAGDRLEAVDDTLFLHRRSGNLDVLDVDAGQANPGDWEQMQQWVAATWPQPGSVSERARQRPKSA
jgi:hypothetical protein